MKWQIIQPLLPLPKTRGRKREIDEREVFNAIFYQIHHSCIWSDLPFIFTSMANSVQILSSMAIALVFGRRFMTVYDKMYDNV
nr:transposase [Chroococcidiopsis sp. [FACHB-1243]]